MSGLSSDRVLLKPSESSSFTPFDTFVEEDSKGLDGQENATTSSNSTPSSIPSTGTRPLIGSTIDIERIYALISPDYSSGPKLKHRILTVPPNGVSNENQDNEDGNLICRVYDVLQSTGKRSYTILETLGTGTFGQVFRCQKDGSGEMVAVKIIKNKRAYHRQGMIEIDVLQQLSTKCEKAGSYGIVKMMDSFEHKQHICIVFELLNMSLLDVLTQNKFRGLPIHIVQRFTKQILQAMCIIEEANIIHCDLKPENILLSNVAVNDGKDADTASASPGGGGGGGAEKESAPGVGQLGDIKVIDFGSACFEGKTAYSYIQSRFYRSPEVLLGVPYNGAIDLWSLACVCTEMFLGVSQHNQLGRIIDMLGMPPDIFLETKQGQKYFKKTATDGGGGADGGKERESKFRLKTAEEYAAETGTGVPSIKKYLRYNKLDEIIMKCPLANKSKLTTEQKQKEMGERESFLDFLRGLFRLNPFERWTSRQAYRHPFIQGTPLKAHPGGYSPLVDSRVNERKLNFVLFMQKRGYSGPGLVSICKSSPSSHPSSTSTSSSTTSGGGGASTATGGGTEKSESERTKTPPPPPNPNPNPNPKAINTSSDSNANPNPNPNGGSDTTTTNSSGANTSSNNNSTGSNNPNPNPNPNTTTTSSSSEKRESRKQRNSPNTKTFQSRISSTYGSGTDGPPGRKKGGISNNVEALERARASGDNINPSPERPPRLQRGQAVQPEFTTSARNGSSNDTSGSIRGERGERGERDGRERRRNSATDGGAVSNSIGHSLQGAHQGMVYANQGLYGSLPAQQYQYYSHHDQHGNVTYYATPSYNDPGAYIHQVAHAGQIQQSQQYGSSMDQGGGYMYYNAPGPAGTGTSVGGTQGGQSMQQYGSPITHGGMYVSDPGGHPMTGSYRPNQQIFAFSPLASTPVYTTTLQGTSPGTSPMSYGASYGSYMTELGHAMIRPGVDEGRQITSEYVQIGNQLIPAAALQQEGYRGPHPGQYQQQPPQPGQYAQRRESYSNNKGRDRGDRDNERRSSNRRSSVGKERRERPSVDEKESNYGGEKGTSSSLFPKTIDNTSEGVMGDSQGAVGEKEEALDTLEESIEDHGGAGGSTEEAEPFGNFEV